MELKRRNKDMVRIKRIDEKGIIVPVEGCSKNIFHAMRFVNLVKWPAAVFLDGGLFFANREWRRMTAVGRRKER